jgi:hypothetical protein
VTPETIILAIKFLKVRRKALINLLLLRVVDVVRLLHPFSNVILSALRNLPRWSPRSLFSASCKFPADTNLS